MSPELVDSLLAGSRWLVYVSVVAVVGARGAQLVASRAGTSRTLALSATLERRLPGLTLAASVLWAASLVGMLAAQALSWFGAEGLTDPERLRTLVFDSRWGDAWSKAFVTSLAAAGALVLARRLSALRPSVVVLAALGAAITTPLLGHAAGAGAFTWILHALHLAGAGLWLGTLLMLAWPTWQSWSDGSSSSADLRRLLTAFTPVALSGAALVVTTGTWLTIAQVWPLDTLFDTPYGVALSRKLVFVGVIAGLGALNWRYFRPGAEIVANRGHLRRGVRAELALGFVVVLALTAWLSGLPAPAG